MRYPPAPRLDLVDVLHGRAVADPYRWLEDESPQTREAVGPSVDTLAFLARHTGLEL